jgi:phosphatidylethanolamine-binding protein (PEBP) family uncharacterized protein
MRVTILLAIACTGTSDDTPGPPQDGDSDADTDADTDTDADADTDADTDEDTDTDAGSTAETGTPAVFEISSPDMLAHSANPCLQQLPKFFECGAFGGENLNPQITWTGVPVAAVSLALLVEDMSIGGFDHWGVYNIPASATGIDQAASGTNPTATMPLGSMQITPYNGPCSNGGNTYRWRLLALDSDVPENMADSIAEIAMYASTHLLADDSMCHCPQNDCLVY